MEVDEETRSFFDRVLREMTAIKGAIYEDRSGTASEFAQLRNEMQTNFDALYKRDEDRQSEYLSIKATLSRVEVSIAHLQLSVTQLEKIEVRVAQLEAAARGDHA